MNKIILIFIILAMFAGIVASIYLRRDDNELPAVTQLETPQPAPPIRIPETRVDQPPQQATEPALPPVPLPALDESDGPVRNEIETLIDNEQFEKLFLVNAIIRNFVVTVDNLTRQKLPQKYIFTRPVEGKFTVTAGDNDEKYLDPHNYDRYTSMIILAEAIDTGKVAAIYSRFNPLLQKAYEELGYPDADFDDRLIEVINHLINAPEIRDPIKLEQPKVYFRFADPQLEALSFGQKMMIRMGQDNARRLKVKLRELEQYLAAIR